MVDTRKRSSRSGQILERYIRGLAGWNIKCTRRGLRTWTCLWKVIFVDSTVRFRYPLQSPPDRDATLRAKCDT